MLKGLVAAMIVGSLLIGPALASGRRPVRARCPTGRVMLRTNSVVVYRRLVPPTGGADALGSDAVCLSKTGRRIRLGQYNIGGGERIENLYYRTAGRFLGFDAADIGSRDGDHTRLVLLNLTTGRRRSLDEGGGLSIRPPGTLVRATALALAANGSMVWIARVINVDANGQEAPPTYELHELTQTTSRVLASGSDIRPTALRLSGGRVSWVQGGTMRTSPA